MPGIDVSITQLTLAGFTNGQIKPVVGIGHYKGRPFYYHVTTSKTDTRILLNQHGPSSTKLAKLTPTNAGVAEITIRYDNGTGQAEEDIIRPDAPLPVYGGGPLALSLLIDDQNGTATFVITQPTAAAFAPIVVMNTPTLGMVVLSAGLSGNPQRTAYFVEVPLSGLSHDPAVPVDPTLLPQVAHIEWQDDGPGSASGPMGGVNVP